MWMAGQSYGIIGKKLGISKPTLIKMNRDNNWPPKGANLPNLHRKEELALETEAARHGVTRGKVFEKLGKFMEALFLLVPTPLGVSRIPLPVGTEVKDGKAVWDGKICIVVDDRGIQMEATKSSIEVLGMKKNVEEAAALGVFSFYRQQLAMQKGQA